MKTLVKLGKIILWVAVSLVGIIGLFLLVMCIILSPEFIRRCLFSGAETVYDYKIFPERAGSQRKSLHL